MSNYRSYQKSLNTYVFAKEEFLNSKQPVQIFTILDSLSDRKAGMPTGVYSIELTHLGTPSARVDFLSLSTTFTFIYFQKAIYQSYFHRDKGPIQVAFLIASLFSNLSL
ncbi:hypothetical protein CQW23_16560 [Capsicum baccatum]|uniref:Uncharacterized protein ycf15 n=1 Tax=Capsicum baccatum TaxID=33114 RepID=A0A2G2WBA5_CAPBA|nr:hypothetical protein CQW23_16560 [Capsicum baccatum]